MKSKICGICSQEKSIKDFYKRKYGSKDGLHGHCKECQKDMSRDWTKNNMDRHSQYTSKWNSENADKMRKHNQKRDRENWIKWRNFRNRYLPDISIDSLRRTSREKREQIYNQYNIPLNVRI